MLLQASYPHNPNHSPNTNPTPSLLAEIKTTETVGPVLLHVVTEKGRGYLPAESASDKMHGVVPYDTVTGKQKQAAAGGKAQVRVGIRFEGGYG